MDLEFLWGNDERKRLLGRPRWEDRIKIDCNGIGCVDADLMYLAQDRYKSRTGINMEINLVFYKMRES